MCLPVATGMPAGHGTHCAHLQRGPPPWLDCRPQGQRPCALPSLKGTLSLVQGEGVFVSSAVWAGAERGPRDAGLLRQTRRGALSQHRPLPPPLPSSPGAHQRCAPRALGEWECRCDYISALPGLAQDPLSGLAELGNRPAGRLLLVPRHVALAVRPPLVPRVALVSSAVLLWPCLCGFRP